MEVVSLSFESLAWNLIESEEDADSKLNRTIVAIGRDFEADGATLFLRLDGSDTFVLAAQSGDDARLPWSSAFKLGQPIAGLVAERRKPLLIEDPADHPSLRSAGVRARRRIGTALVLPICSPQGALAVLNLTRRPTSKPYSQSDFESLTALGKALAPAFAHLRSLATQARRADNSSFKQERLAALFESLRVAVIAFDGTGIVLTANKPARKLLGVKKDAGLRWNTLAEKLPPALATTVRSSVLAPSKKTAEVEVEAKTYRVSAAKLAGSGVACFIEDVSGQVNAERELGRVKRLAEIGQMTAAIAHEIRNPLTSIRGAAQILQSEAEIGQARAWGKVIESEADTLNKLCDSFLDFAKPMPLLPRPTDVNELVERILSLSEAEAAEANVSISFSRSGEQPIIRADADRLAQAVRNLVRNALDAMPVGGNLTVQTDTTPSHVSISVSDTGGGIAKEDMPKLFTPFFTTKPSGTGLGLCNTLRIVESHGGKIETDSVDGGAKFTLILPIGEVNKVAA